MEQKHTPEPWRVVGYSEIVAKTGDAQYAGVASVLHNENDARRIVACVNACRGLSTDELERFGLASAFGTELIELEKQRDQLLAALECIANSHLLPSKGDPTVLREYAMHIIATTKEQK